MALIKVSGFTFIHNGVEGGYPFVQAIRAVGLCVDEIVVVDMQSTDETRQVLDKLDVRVIDGKWIPGVAEGCLAPAHALHVECNHDTILHFEADEVYDENLVHTMVELLQDGYSNLYVYRLQVEQNFQRCRWYPELVHRVFPKGSVRKVGHTTDVHETTGAICSVSGGFGFLWDCTNCFRDDWRQRIHNNAELWGDQLAYRYTPHHFTFHVILQEHEIDGMLQEEHWTWKHSPFDLPESLRELLGITSYKEWLMREELIACIG